MAAFRVEDLKVSVGTCRSARSRVQVQALLRAMEKQGWQLNGAEHIWRSPDDKAHITEQCMVASVEVAEDVFLGWLDRQSYKTPNVRLPDLRRDAQQGIIVPVKASTADKNWYDNRGNPVPYPPRCDEPVNDISMGYIPCKAEPDDPLKWLDSQVEAVCKAGRL